MHKFKYSMRVTRGTWVARSILTALKLHLKAKFAYRHSAYPVQAASRFIKREPVRAVSSPVNRLLQFLPSSSCQRSHPYWFSFVLLLHFSVAFDIPHSDRACLQDLLRGWTSLSSFSSLSQCADTVVKCLLLSHRWIAKSAENLQHTVALWTQCLSCNACSICRRYLRVKKIDSSSARGIKLTSVSSVTVHPNERVS